MTRRRLLNVMLKEWQLLFTDLNSALFVTLLPLLIAGQGTAYVWLAINYGGEAISANAMLQTALQKLAQAVPSVAGLTAAEQIHVLLLSQFNFFLLLIPTMVAVAVATFSIVDEKVTGSLEALLATPVRTWELLMGKALAGAIPALIITWVCAGVFLLAATALGWGNAVRLVVTPSWYLSLFMLTPAVALLSFVLGIINSSKAKDARSAQSLSVTIILPVFALIAVQVTGLAWFTAGLTLALALGIIAIDVLTLRIAVRLFQRESIVIRWR